MSVLIFYSLGRGDNIDIKMVGMCHSTYQNETQKFSNLDHRVLNLSRFLKGNQKIDPQN